VEENDVDLSLAWRYFEAMSSRARLIAALLVLIAIVGVCTSYHSHATLVTALRAAQAAAAIGMTLALAAIASPGRLPGRRWKVIRSIVPPVLPPAVTRPGLVLLC
jgi:hypothetical protein